MSLPTEIYSADNVRQIDHNAIHDAGISGYTLMTRAAEAALNVALEHFPDARRWQIVCGAGNNAGDGYVLARLASQADIEVSVLSLTSPEKLGGDAKTAFEDFAAIGGSIGDWDGLLDPDANLLVDSIVGSGLQRKIEGQFAEAVKAINGHPAPVFALDVPTGVATDDGRILGVAVQAAITMTFVGLKAGLFLRDGPICAGQLHFADLGIPPECRRDIAVEMRRISAAAVAAALPPRDRNAHKGDFGNLLIIGGGPGMPGAVLLAGEAALRSGAGLVTVATHPSHHAEIVVGRPELMCRGIEEADDLEELLAKAEVIAIGPGLGTDHWATSVFEKAINCKLPSVVDADALNLLASSPARADQRIITPHPGEAGRLLAVSTAEVQADRRLAVSALQEKYGGTVVLKGAGTLVSSETGPVWLCSAGNPGMAAPGMGDVLTGIIAGLLAQGLEPEVAATTGVAVHAAAGDAAAVEGQRGLMASDLLQKLRTWVNPAQSR